MKVSSGSAALFFQQRSSTTGSQAAYRMDPLDWHLQPRLALQNPWLAGGKLVARELVFPFLSASPPVEFVR